MRKLIFMLITALSVALTSCSAFDSEPIEPKIIGSGNLQYEPQSGTWFVAVDSTQYTVTNVTILDHNLRSFLKTRDIEPVAGMLVTIFTSPLAVKTTFRGCFYPRAYDGLRFELQHTTKQKTSPKGGSVWWWIGASMTISHNFKRENICYLTPLKTIFCLCFSVCHRFFR